MNCGYDIGPCILASLMGLDTLPMAYPLQGWPIMEPDGPYPSLEPDGPYRSLAATCGIQSNHSLLF